MASTSDRHQEDKQLRARIEDACRLCERRNIPRFIGFLDEREAMLAQTFFNQQHSACAYRPYGGHDDAERVLGGIFPAGMETEESLYPITPIAFRFRKEADISHRDVLGSVLGCGIVREKIGDIVCSEGLAVVFVHDDIASFVADSVDRIGREGVTVERPFTGELPAFRQYRPLSGTVASPRLDAILKVLLGVSREQAAAMIDSALVSVNHSPVTSASRSLKEGDVLSVRGYGRFIIDDVSGVSKKGRVILLARQYV